MHSTPSSSRLPAVASEPGFTSCPRFVLATSRSCRRIAAADTRRQHSAVVADKLAKKPRARLLRSGGSMH